MIVAERLAESDNPAITLPIAPPALIALPSRAERVAALDREVDAIMARASNLEWLVFAGECERLMRRAGIDCDRCCLGDAWGAYEAGLTPAHYVYAVCNSNVLDLLTGRSGGGAHSPPPRSSPLSASDYWMPGPPFPMPPAKPTRSQLAATASAACVSLVVGAVTALALVNLPPAAPAAAQGSDIAELAAPSVLRVCAE
jgi:hypothetical protein